MHSLFIKQEDADPYRWRF